MFAFPCGKYLSEQPKMLGSHFKKVFTTQHGFNWSRDTVLLRNEVSGLLHMYAAISGSLYFFAFMFKKEQ